MRKFLKILLYTIGSILLLLILIVVLLQTPAGKELVRKQAVKYLNGKLGGRVSVQKVDYTLPKWLSLQGVLVKDKQNDTLLNVKELRVDMDMLKLISSKVYVNKLLLDSAYINVYRNLPDTNFNYQFIIDAFASPDTTKVPETKDTGTGTLALNVKRVELNNILLKYNDQTGGTFFYADLKHLLLRPRTIDLSQSLYEVKELSIQGLRSGFSSDTSYIPKQETADTGVTPLRLIVDKINLSDAGFVFDGRQDSLHFDVIAGSLQGKIDSLNLATERIAVDNLQLENATSHFIMGKMRPKTPEASPDDNDTSSVNWKINAKDLMLKQINFAFDNNNDPRLGKGIDYSHLDFKNFSLNASDAYWTMDSTSANIKHLAVAERSGLQVIEMRTSAVYDNKGASLKNLFIQTPNSIIQDNVAISYPSLDDLQKDLGKMQTNISLTKTRVAINDVLIFMPLSQRDILTPYANQSIQLSGKIYGYLNNLDLQNLYIAGLKNTQVLLSGKLKGLPDADKLSYNFQIGKLHSSYQDIAAFLPDSLKQQIRVPDWFDINGNISGTIKDYYPKLTIKTSDGDITLNGYLLLSPGEGREKYDLAFATNALNAGKILMQDSLIGTATMNGTVTGTGFDYKTMSAALQADVQSLWFKGYNYQNVSLNGHIEAQTAQVQLNSKDANADLLADATFNLSKENPSVTGTFDIHNLDLHALNLYSDTLQLKGNITADFPSLNPDYPVGSLIWAKPQVNLDSAFVTLDTISLSSQPDADSSQHITFNISNFITGSLTGHIPLTKIGSAALAHINKYYRLSDTITDAPLQYDMFLNMRAGNHPFLQNLLPSLNNFKDLYLTAIVSPEEFTVDGYSNKVGYAGSLLDSLSLHMDEDNDQMNYDITAYSYTYGSSIQLWKPLLTGYLRDDTLVTNASISDSAFNEQFAFGGSMYLQDTSATFVHIFPGLKFDYNEWNVNPDNLMAFGSQGFYINDLSIHKDDQSISANSLQPSVYNAPLDVNIQNFSLSNITSMMSRDTLIADGILNVKGSIDLKDSFPKVQADMTLDSLRVFEKYLGTLSADAHNDDANTYSINALLKENENNVRLAGQYHLEPVNGNNLDFNLNIDPISTRTLEALSFNNIKNSSGYLRGTMQLRGTIDTPKITGELHTDSLATTVTSIGLPLLLPHESILFDSKGMSFNNFTILNKNNRKAVLNGTVRTRNYRDYFLKLNLNADRFQVMNSTKKDNSQFYGKMFVSANLDMKGYATAPTISGSLQILDSTNAYFALLDATPQAESADGIVKFINGKDTTANQYQIDTAINREKMLASRVSQINMNISIDSAATFNVIVDPQSGSNLSVRGEAALSTEMGPDGTISLTGIYTLNSGYYELNYNLLKRKFLIQSGSTITFAGDPLKATADITAAYNANVAPYELVQQQISDPAQLVYYKQRLPFQVLLKLNGEVLQPQTTFDIVLAENKSTTASTDVTNMVQTKLSSLRNSPSDINKQAFAILILGRFVSDDPFATSFNAEYYVRQSAARLLSQQLNQIADQLVKGLELSLDLSSDEDYSTGQKVNRTDLNVSASKRLFNDRLTLTVGNDFQLEGQPVQGRQSSYMPGTLSADYMLTADGRYVIRAYRNSQMQNIIDGYVTETGVSFRLTMDYNRFKQIFRSQKKAKALRQKWQARMEQDLQQQNTPTNE